MTQTSHSDRCETCGFWKDYGAYGTGTCRYKPPVWTGDAFRQPTTSKEDWCGEHSESYAIWDDTEIPF